MTAIYIVDLDHTVSCTASPCRDAVAVRNALDCFSLPAAPR